LIFFVGMHQPADVWRVPFACISINRLRDRKAKLNEPAAGWMMDSGAFTELTTHGCYRYSAREYAREAARWVTPKLLCIVAQDYMCEPCVLKKTGLTLEDHQRLTVERYDALVEAWEAERVARGATDWPPIMPVLQGWTVADYLRHIEMYGDRLTPGMWVGVGSVCKRQGSVQIIENILFAIARARPDLHLHGFGVKLTALRSPLVRLLLATADSMAWSYSARKQGRNGNSPDEALAFCAKVDSLTAPSTRAITAA
jgi:hypothetical protein